MIVARTLLNQNWIDVSSPTKEDVDALMLSYNIGPSIARDLLSPTPKQQTRGYDDSFYAVIHIPIFGRNENGSESQEVDCVITENSLVTVRYDSIDALHYFAKQMEASEILGNQDEVHPLFGMMKEVYKHLGHELASIEGWLGDIEHKIFQGQEKEMVISISAVARHLLSFRRIVAPHFDVWQNLHNLSKQKFGDEFGRETHLLIEEVKRLVATAENLTEMVSELRETNNSMLSTKQNEIMKVLTIMAFVTFPLSLIAAIFGMNTSFIPLIGLPYDFWLVIGIMLCATLAMFTFFRYKKWI
jgi:magnesium transporter